MNSTDEENESALAEAEVVESPAGGHERWPMDRVVAAVEALLFSCPDTLPLRVIRRILPDPLVTGPMIDEALQILQKRFAGPASGMVLTEVGGGYRLMTSESLYPWVQQLVKAQTEDKITTAALETLAIVAYKQPITRAEIDNIRGVGCGQIIRTLMDRGMVKVVGRVELPGRPFQYGTTPHFLEHFGLRSLADLPGDRDL